MTSCSSSEIAAVISCLSMSTERPVQVEEGSRDALSAALWVLSGIYFIEKYHSTTLCFSLKSLVLGMSAKERSVKILTRSSWSVTISKSILVHFFIYVYLCWMYPFLICSLYFTTVYTVGYFVIIIYISNQLLVCVFIEDSRRSINIGSRGPRATIESHNKHDKDHKSTYDES